MEKTVVELFSGVGGFRVGLNDVKLVNNKVKEKPIFDFVWANQWEPSTKTQHAFECYITRFGNTFHHSNEDISKVNKELIPDHTLLVGGFPCQDYSVARSLSKEQGIQGKKGVLWWEIHEILKYKRPPFVLLENVDRLLKSPSKQRGRDFGVMLRSMNDLGYGVEWRVINAADYGFAQRRRRVFIFGFHKSTNFYLSLSKQSHNTILEESGLFSSTFKVTGSSKSSSVSITKKEFSDLADLSDNFKFDFYNSGIALKHKITTSNLIPLTIKPTPLSKIVLKQPVDSKYYLDKDLAKFEYLKGSKKIPRSKNGNDYVYSEGAIPFPDPLSKPARTMLTSEGTTNRSTHIIEDPTNGKYRKLTPVETERLNGFPDNWTNTGMNDSRRYFMMGNALVTGVLSKLGKSITQIFEFEENL
jgi:DNA (cytosine-5)-methyltransferase 1